MNKYIKTCKDFAKYCQEHKQELSSLFLSIETYKTSIDEIERGISALLDIDMQTQYFIRNDIEACSVYMPKNQPFYSLVLFAIIPSFFCKTVYVRPPVILREAYTKLEKIVDKFFPNIKFNYDSRRKFLNNYTQKSSVVIYTGKPENATEILQEISSDTLFIYNGGGCNPIVVTDSCDINDNVITKVVGAQLYNSGQDCMAPSAIIVHSAIYDEFLNALIENVKSKKVGSNDDVETDVGPLLDKINIEEIQGLLDNSTVIYGAKYDTKNNVVFPTILAYDDLEKLPQQELYMPIFCIYKYESDEQITKYLSTEWPITNSTYISVFGNGEISFEYGKYILIKNDILDSVDNGYTEFGGYGINSSYYSIQGKKHAQPILISREICKYAK